MSSTSTGFGRTKLQKSDSMVSRKQVYFIVQPFLWFIMRLCLSTEVDNKIFSNYIWIEIHTYLENIVILQQPLKKDHKRSCPSPMMAIKLQLNE